MQKFKYYKQFTGTGIDSQVGNLMETYRAADIKILDIVYTHTSTDTVKER